MDWIQNIILTDELQQSIEEKINIINKHLGTNFTTKTSLYEVLEAISKEWNKQKQ